MWKSLGEEEGGRGTKERGEKGYMAPAVGTSFQVQIQRQRRCRSNQKFEIAQTNFGACSFTSNQTEAVMWTLTYMMVHQQSYLPQWRRTTVSPQTATFTDLGEEEQHRSKRHKAGWKTWRGGGQKIYNWYEFGLVCVCVGGGGGGETKTAFVVWENWGGGGGGGGGQEKQNACFWFGKIWGRGRKDTNVWSGRRGGGWWGTNVWSGRRGGGWRGTNVWLEGLGVERYKKKTPVTPENWDGTEGGKNAQVGHIMCITRSTAASSEVNRRRWGRRTVCLLIFRGSRAQFHNVAGLPSFTTLTTTMSKHLHWAELQCTFYF